MLLTTAFLVAAALAAPDPNPDAPGVLPIRLSAKRQPQHASLHRRAESGSSNLTITGGSVYSATIEVGTPPQAINVDFYLSQISQLRLYEGGAQRAAEYTPHIEYFVPGQSSTFKTTNQTLPGSRGYNETGRFESDVVSIGGYTFNDFAFYGTNDSSETGILGAFRQGGHLAVGFDADTTGDFGDPIWKRIVANGGKAEAGLYLERIALSDGLRHKIDGTVQENAGELMLGGLNSKYYQGDINYLNTTYGERDGIFVHFEGFKVNGEQLSATNETVDTGVARPSGNGNYTYDVSVPGPVDISPGSGVVNLGNETFTALHAKIPGATPVPESVLTPDPSQPYYAMYVPCNTSVEISLSFNGQDYPLRPQDWITTNSSTPGENCISMFIHFPKSDNSVGDLFLQSVYTAVKFDTRQVGFARLVDGLPTRNTTVDGTATVDVPTPTRTYVNGAGTESAKATPSSTATALQPAFVAALLPALGVAAVSLLV